MTSFYESALAHLSEYLLNHLGVVENGLWDGNPYAHILPQELSQLN